jgi:hypothetical protein
MFKALLDGQKVPPSFENGGLRRSVSFVDARDDSSGFLGHIDRDG